METRVKLNAWFRRERLGPEAMTLNVRLLAHSVNCAYWFHSCSLFISDRMEYETCDFRKWYPALKRVEKWYSLDAEGGLSVTRTNECIQIHVALFCTEYPLLRWTHFYKKNFSKITLHIIIYRSLAIMIHTKKYNYGIKVQVCTLKCYNSCT